MPKTNLVADRLSSCRAFREAPGGNEERAAFVEEVKGCALCLSWKGDHVASACPATQRGQPYKPCQKCGKKHHGLLHGTQNAYVNHKSRGKPKNPAKENSSQSSRPESAVLTISGEGTETYDRPPTESEIKTQDREGMNTMFLVEEVTVERLQDHGSPCVPRQWEQHDYD